MYETLRDALSLRELLKSKRRAIQLGYFIKEGDIENREDGKSRHWQYKEKPMKSGNTYMESKYVTDICHNDVRQ